MATREDIITGLETLIRETRRAANDLTEEQWAKNVDLDGWKSSEVLAHIAAVGSIVQPMLTNFTSAPAGSNAIEGVNIDQLNAGLVAARAGKSTAELADEVESNYRGVIEFVRTAPDDLLDHRLTVGGYVDVPASDILIRMVVMHGMAHLYSAYSTVFGSTGS